MNGNRLKFLRVAVSLAVLIGLTVALVGWTTPVPTKVGGWLASVQFIPSLLALTAGASLSLACVVIVVATLLVGRIYCSFLCPLGALQDVIARISSALGKKKRTLSYAEPVPRMRVAIFLITVIGLVSGWAGLVLSLVDPYSNFGRIASLLLRPLLKFGFRAVSGFAKVKEAASDYPATIHWTSLGAILFAIAVLGLVSVMAALRGRLYCNTVCPVGTLLGFVSTRAAFRLQVNRAACRQCAKCVRVCKAQCIDSHSGSIDSSRCVACYNCIPACEGGFIAYRWNWEQRKSKSSLEPGLTPAPASDPEPIVVSDYRRRALITKGILVLGGVMGSELLSASERLQSGSAKQGMAQGGNRLEANYREERPVRPPGSVSVERFLNRCTACQLCASVCPTHVLQPSSLEYGVAGLMKPHLDFAVSFCDYDCRRCGEVCPSGALDRLNLSEKRLTRVGLAQLDFTRCIVQTKRTACALCVDRCPAKAIETVPFGENLRQPQVKALLCIGCGRCEYECPVQPQKAITVFGLLRETHVPKGAHGESLVKGEAS